MLKKKRHLFSLSFFFGATWARSWTKLFRALCILILAASVYALPCLNQYANANGCFSVCRSYWAEVVSRGEAALLLWCLRQGTLFSLRCRLICGRFKVGQSFWFGSARGWWASCRFLPFLGYAERTDQVFDAFLKMKWNLPSRSGWALHLDSSSTEGNSLAK